MKTKIAFLLLAIVFLPASSLFSQNVSVTDDAGYTAVPSAMLDVKSDSKGFLVPRLTNAQMNAIIDPATGFLYITLIKKVFAIKLKRTGLS